MLLPYIQNTRILYPGANWEFDIHSLNRTYGQKSSELIVDNSSQQIQKEVKSCKKEKSTINFKAWKAVFFFSWPATTIGDKIVETLL